VKTSGIGYNFLGAKAKRTMPTRKRRTVEDLSIPELRHLLLEKEHNVHDQRLAHYQKTGRVVHITREPGLEPEKEISILGIDPILDIPAKPGKRRGQTRWVDSLLFLVEAAAVIGLIFVLFNGFSVLRNLNREVIAALEQPTLIPTPLIVAVVLPGGHTPPNSAEGAQPNSAEIPEHLLPIVQSLANIPIPTASPEQAIRIQIPAIKVDAPVVQGDGWDQLRKGVGQNVGSSNPGKSGNVVLSAHNDVFGEIFKDLDKLKNGDQIILFTVTRQYTYTIQKSLIVEPTFVEVMQETIDPTVTLISCYPYLVDKQRIVVQGTLQN
jgi:sortase A